MTVYAVALSKGGSTKTTTAAELGAAPAPRGRRVPAVGPPPPGNLTSRPRGPSRAPSRPGSEPPTTRRCQP